MFSGIKWSLTNFYERFLIFLTLYHFCAILYHFSEMVKMVHGNPTSMNWLWPQTWDIPRSADETPSEKIPPEWKPAHSCDSLRLYVPEGGVDLAYFYCPFLPLKVQLCANRRRGYYVGFAGVLYVCTLSLRINSARASRMRAKCRVSCVTEPDWLYVGLC